MPTVHDDVRRTAEGVEVGTRAREYIAGALYPAAGLNATGPQCECACGRNHGKHHSH